MTNTTRHGALTLLEKAVSDGRPHFYCFCEANLLSHALSQPELRSALRHADQIFPDGIALLLLARLRQSPLTERITGPGFMLDACRYGISRGWRHFFYGGAPGIAETLAQRLSDQFPGLVVAGTWCPPFRPLSCEEENLVRRTIEDARPDLLWVGLGGPKQEFWIAQHLGKIKVPIMLAVGAAFDFHSGNRAWAPPLIRKIGLEWAYRAVTGGPKTFVRNIKCVAKVAKHLTQVAFRAPAHQR